MKNDKKNNKLVVGFLPLTLKLYETLIPETGIELQKFTDRISKELVDSDIEILPAPVVATKEEIENECLKFKKHDVDLLVVIHLTYSPSEEIYSTLLDIDLPVLIWPAQLMEELDPSIYDSEVLRLNHGMHGAIDLASVLNRNGRRFGIMYKHWQDNDFRDELKMWTRAGKFAQTMRKSNPVVLGGYFDGMLDLQLDGARFIDEFGVCKKDVPLEEYVRVLKEVDDSSISSRMDGYDLIFDYDKDLDEELMIKAVRHEIALERLLEEKQSSVCGINFAGTCDSPEINDSMHFAASKYMAMGGGYAGEGDWITAMLVGGLQAAAGPASFTELFSIGYRDSRLVLRHWGEGNYNMGRNKPRLTRSMFKNSNGSNVEFVVVDFEFAPSKVSTLVNLNSTADGGGQVISILGNVEEDSLPKLACPRAVFKTADPDAGKLLENYASNGGSHHFAMVNGDCSDLLGKAVRLLGWDLINL